VPDTGTWAHAPGDGHEAPGAAQADSGISGTAQLVHMVSPCLTVLTGRTYSYGAFLKWVSGADPDSFQMMTALYSSPDCTGGSVGPPVSVDPATSGWNQVSGGFSTDATQGSVRLIVEVRQSAGQAFRVLLDDIYLLPSGSGSGSVCSDPANVLSAQGGNCSFTTAFSWWVPDTGSWVHAPGDGHDAPGAAQADSGISGTAQLAHMVSPCLTVVAGQTYNYGAFLKWVSGADPDSFQMMTALYSSTDCTGGSVGPPVSVDPSTSGWNKVSGSFAAGAGQESVRLVVEVGQSAGQSFRVLLDDVFLGEGLMPVGLSQFSVD
jgi:hypothetical protein